VTNCSIIKVPDYNLGLSVTYMSRNLRSNFICQELHAIKLVTLVGGS